MSRTSDRLHAWIRKPVDLQRHGRKTGAIGWLGLVGYIVAFDILAIRTSRIETLTRSFWRAGKHPVASLFVYAAWILVTFHLLFESHVRSQMSRKVS